ncbi:MAG TPA: hypothetical protein VF698_14795 [Thermoanaerobaculia bacterium]|jgi:hypothetical protein
MKHAAVLACLLLTFCATGGGPRSASTATPGHGAISIEIVPNPIVATRASGNNYDFAFEVVVRETGGRAVTIERVSADVLALGSIRVAQESYDAARIQSLGFQTTVPANGTLRYRFTQRREVPDDRLFGSVSAEVRVDGHDDAGTPTTARTTVTVTR